MEEMTIEIPKSKVYVLLDGVYVIAIDGGYSMQNVNTETWTYIDEGEGDKYNLCQNNYLEKPVYDEYYRTPNYAYDGVLRETTPDEKLAWQEAHTVVPEPTPIEVLTDKVDALEAAAEDTLLLELMADHEERLCMMEIMA